MASVLTTREQRETSDVARKVGGYSELIRIEGELRRIKATGAEGSITRDHETKRYSVVSVPRT